MKFIGYTVVYNEEAMMPYILPYIKSMGYDKLVIYDDGSTDRTLEILSNELSSAGIVFEVRPTSQDSTYGFDSRKRGSQLESFCECKEMAISTGESVWMSWTDFDEVVYCSRERQKCFKEYLEVEDRRGYNYFDGRMLHLTWDGKESDENLFPHEWNGVRGTWWLSEGMKPTLIKVNDFTDVWAFCGNHCFGVRMEDGKLMKSLSDCGEFHGFHFKYFDEKLFMEKPFNTSKNNTPKKNILRIKSASFPLDYYFFEMGLRAKQSLGNPIDYGEGLFLK